MTKGLCIGFVIAAALSTSVALADGTSAVPAAPPAKRGEMTMETVRIALRVPRPNASITVLRVPVDSTLARLKKPLVDRIAQAAEKEPF